MKASPVATQITPGTKKAARQPNRSISAPVMIPATAIPPFPKTPLMPSAVPCRSALRTSQAIPTGW